MCFLGESRHGQTYFLGIFKKVEDNSARDVGVLKTKEWQIHLCFLNRIYKANLGVMLEKELVWVKWVLVRVLKDGDAVDGEKETVFAAQTSSFTGGMMCFLGYLHALGERHSNPLQYSWLENPMDRGTWQAMVHRVTKSQTKLKQLSTHAPDMSLKKGEWVGSSRIWAGGGKEIQEGGTYI